MCKHLLVYQGFRFPTLAVRRSHSGADPHLLDMFTASNRSENNGKLHGPPYEEAGKEVTGGSILLPVYRNRIVAIDCQPSRQIFEALPQLVPNLP